MRLILFFYIWSHRLSSADADLTLSHRLSSADADFTLSHRLSSADADFAFRMPLACVQWNAFRMPLGGCRGLVARAGTDNTPPATRPATGRSTSTS